MILIVRLYPKREINKVWEFIENEIEKEESGVVTPLYASQTEGMCEVSTIFDVKDPDNIAHFLTENISQCDECHHTKTVALMKPVFFPIPKKKPEVLHRYILHINTHPKYYKELYNYLIGYNYPENIFPIYISYSLGDEDILMSLAADSYETMKDFVRKRIQSKEGIELSALYPVIKSKRFAPLSKLVEYQKKFLAEKAKKIPEEEIDLEFDWTFEEYAKLTGAFPRDL